MDFIMDMDEWNQIGDAVYVQSGFGVTTWAALFQRVGTAGNLADIRELYFNSDGDLWE